MPSFEHQQIVERVSELAVLPDAPDEYETWINASKHLRFLQRNSRENELVIHANGHGFFVQSAVVKERRLFPIDQGGLLEWNCPAPRAIASYSYRGNQGDVWISNDGHDWGTETLKGAHPLVFRRDFEGSTGEGNSYFEVLQEYAHVAEIHWRPERHAYCCFDERGDFDQIVSVTTFEGTDGKIELVSFKREPLEQYLAVSNSVLVRLFDFTLANSQTFHGWPDGKEFVFSEAPDFFYRQKVIAGYAAYTRGVQIVRFSRPKTELIASIFGSKEQEHVEFLAWDFRNDSTVEDVDDLSNYTGGTIPTRMISTDPSATTNYFVARGNSLPFETSPAFFGPEVLHKYKGDRHKYTVGNERISCRNAWEINYGVNEAGQVHAYIYDLDQLPYNEQMYWKSFNQAPKAGISERAVSHGFKGEWSSITTPFEDIQAIVFEWSNADVAWWKLDDDSLLYQDITPRTDSRGEWAEAFLDLSKLVVDGFRVKPIRAKLRERGRTYRKDERSLALLEQLLASVGDSTYPSRLDGLRQVQAIRSKVKAHSGGAEAENLSSDALLKHGSYFEHFNHVCRIVAGELKVIETLFT